MYRASRIPIPIGWLAAAALLVPVSAPALTIDPNPFPVSAAGVAGEVALLSVVSGMPAGGYELIGQLCERGTADLVDLGVARFTVQ